MSKTSENIKKEYGIITLIFNDKEYSSKPIDLNSNEKIVDYFFHLSEYGISGINTLKFPISNNEFVVFNYEQLLNCAVKIKIFANESINTIHKDIEFLKS